MMQKSHLISIISYFMVCLLSHLGSVPAAYAVVAGGCDWPIQ